MQSLWTARLLRQSTRLDHGRPDAAVVHGLPSQQLFRLCSLYRSQLICFLLISSIIGLWFPLETMHTTAVRVMVMMATWLYVLTVSWSYSKLRCIPLETSATSYEPCRGVQWAPVQSRALPRCVRYGCSRDCVHRDIQGTWSKLNFWSA